MNEPTRPNFHLQRAMPVAGPGIADDWQIPTDKPAGAELLPPLRKAAPQQREEVPQDVTTSSTEQNTNPLKKKRAAGLTTRRPTDMETTTYIVEMIKKVRPQARKKIARLIYELFN